MARYEMTVAAMWMMSCPLFAQLTEPPSAFALPAFTQPESEWTWQPVPDGLLYRSYAAGPKEPRFSTAFLYDSRRSEWIVDATVGARVGVVRYGTSDGRNAEGWQFDLEGAASPRLNGSVLVDLESTDYRFGALWTYSSGRFAYKFGYTHISSHVGDEFVGKNSAFQRRNYVKESFIVGSRFRVSAQAELYGEMSWAPVYDGGAEPLELQFGGEFAGHQCSTNCGGPFSAVNFQLREETNLTPAINALTGWQWTGRSSGTTFRIGVQYYSGPTSHVQFLNRRDHLVGIGTWFDF